MDTNRNPRSKLWAILLTASSVCIASLVAVIPPEGSRTSNQKWMISVMSISILFSFFGGLLSMMPNEGGNRKIELMCINICFVFWVAGTPSLLNEDNGYAANAAGIANANLYFFGWACMLTTILLGGSYVKEASGDAHTPTAIPWTMLVASSLVVLATVADDFREYCPKLEYDDSERDEEVCRRAKFAIWLGAISAVIACGSVGLRSAPFPCQATVSLLLLVSWACGVSYITFGEGPGTEIGNVYFGTWLSLFLSVNIFTTSVRYTLHPPQDPDDDDDDDDDEKKGDGDDNDEEKGEKDADDEKEDKEDEKDADDEKEDKEDPPVGKEGADDEEKGAA